MDLRKILTVLLISALFLSSIFPTAGALNAMENQQEMDATDWAEYFVQEDLQNPEPIYEINANEKETAVFEYNAAGLRISKTFAGQQTIYSYDDDGNMISEQTPEGNIITYQYSSIEGQRLCTGFTYHQETYCLQRNSAGDVQAVIANDGRILCRYEYEGAQSHCMELTEGKWAENTEETYIGNINPWRYNSWYFDRETGCYHLGGGVYFDSIRNEYIMNPFSLKHNTMRIAPRNDLYNEASQMAVGYLNTTAYNAAKPQVSRTDWNQGKRWYDNLSSEEIAARSIYGENFGTGQEGQNNRLANVCVLVNRIQLNSNNSLRSVLTSAGAFSTVNPSGYSANACSYARQAQNPTDSVWKHASILGCLLSLSTSKSAVESAVGGWPAGIDNQQNFFGLDAVYNSLEIKSGKLYYGSTWMKDVAIAGVGKLNVSSATSAQELLEDYYGGNKHNIFFIYSR